MALLPGREHSTCPNKWPGAIKASSVLSDRTATPIDAEADLGTSVASDAECGVFDPQLPPEPGPVWVFRTTARNRKARRAAKAKARHR